MRKRCGGFQILLAAELLLTIVLLAGSFQKEKTVYAFFGEDVLELTQQAEDGRVFDSDRIELLPGVYQIRAWTRLAEDERVMLEMRADASFLNALRSNGINIAGEQDFEEWEVYVLDKVQTAYLHCEFYGTDADALVRLEVCRTPLGSRILLITALAFFGALDFLILFRRRVVAGKVTKRRQAVFWILTSAVILSCLPLLTDYFSFGADTAFHLRRIAYLKDTLQQGSSLPVRIQSTWVYDHGYATSLFYGDLFLLLPALLQMAGFPIMLTYKIFVFLVTAATAAIAYSSFYKCVKDEYAALAGSLIYLLLPFRLFSVYSEGAVGKYVAMAFLPLICCGMYLLYTEGTDSREYRRYKWYIVWGMSAVLQCHLITTELTAALMALFCIVFWKKTFRRQTFLQLLETVGIVLVLNAWLWVPMLYLLGTDSFWVTEVTQAGIQERGVELAGYFQLLPNKGMGGDTAGWYCEPVQLGAGAVMLLALYVIWRIGGGRKDTACSVTAVFCALLLLLSTRYFPWDAAMKLPLVGRMVGSLQFPARWMSAAAVFAAMFAAFFCRRAGEDGGRLLRMGVGAAMTVAVLSAVYHVDSIAIESGAVYLYNIENMGTLGVANGEYLLEETDLYDVSWHGPSAEEGLLWEEYEKRGTNVSIRVRNTSEETRFLELPLFGYKGYAVAEQEERQSGAAGPYIAEDRGAHGDLKLAVPAGYEGTLRISYEGLWLFHAAEAVSLAGLAAVLGLSVRAGRRKRHEI